MSSPRCLCVPKRWSTYSKRKLPKIEDVVKAISNMIENNDKFPTDYEDLVIDINGWELFIHPGTEGTLECISEEFETCYVSDNLRMVGYFSRVESDHLLLAGSYGTVYRAEDTILHVEGKNGFSRYIEDGPQQLGFYDYYGHLDQTGKIKCIKGCFADEVKFRIEHFSSEENQGAEEESSQITYRESTSPVVRCHLSRNSSTREESTENTNGKQSKVSLEQLSSKEPPIKEESTENQYEEQASWSTGRKQFPFKMPTDGWLFAFFRHFCCPQL